MAVLFSGQGPVLMRRPVAADNALQVVCDRYAS